MQDEIYVEVVVRATDQKSSFYGYDDGSGDVHIEDQVRHWCERNSLEIEDVDWQVSATPNTDFGL